MENDIKERLHETLIIDHEIKLSLTYVSKGFLIEIEIGNKRNEECGPIWDELNEWFSSSSFLDYLINHSVFHNFDCAISEMDNEIYFDLVIKGDCYDDEYPDELYLHFEEEFILNELKISLSNLNMVVYDEEKLKVQFYKKKGNPIERLVLLCYKDQWQPIKLDERQYEVLNTFLESRIEKVLPTYDIEFEHEIQWELDCSEMFLDFNYWSSPIKLKLNDILS